MGRYDYTPNPRIVARAAYLWIQMLSSPKYDNLGERSPEPLDSQVKNMMASRLTEMLPKNNTPEVHERFGAELQKILMGPFEWKSNWNNVEETHTSILRSLHVDYHPDVALAEAAKRAGLTMEFPWKTDMWLDETFLSVSYGYGAPRVYHYPLSRDRWLVARLSGEDVAKIISLIEGDVLTVDLEKTLEVNA